uniref:Uncharacterized protein n=1 Tax=Meloidogyne enterolobii TaxID=390850 RepID=A0A6V7XV43_MELEN|nr:unnamed protein product [Meloidogyne enterolobii]
MKLTKKFGKLFLTIKIGPRMRLRKNYICSDPNLLEELFNTKQFANFSERNSVNYVRPDVAHLFLANGERWANLRKSASIFTNKNIRSMNKLIEDSIIDVLNEMKIGAKKCDVVDFCDYADLFFAAMISKIAFSLIFPNVNLNKFPQKYVNFAKDLIIKKEQHKENEQKQKQFGLFKVLYNHILIDKQDIKERYQIIIMRKNTYLEKSKYLNNIIKLV